MGHEVRPRTTRVFRQAKNRESNQSQIIDSNAGERAWSIRQKVGPAFRAGLG